MDSYTKGVIFEVLLKHSYMNLDLDCGFTNASNGLAYQVEYPTRHSLSQAS